METSLKKFKVTKSAIFTYLVFFVFTTSELMQMVPMLNNVVNIIRCIIFLIFIWNYIAGKKSAYVNLVVLWQFFYLISSVANNNFSISVIFYLINFITIALFVKENIEQGSLRFLRIGRNWFLFLLIINLFQVLFLAPYKTETGDVYVLGLRITFTLYCYVAIFFSIAYDYYKKENYRISGTTLFSIVLAVITLLTQMVATGLIGLLAIFIAYCILKKEKNYWLLILIAILATYGTVFQADYIQVFGSFFKIFGKDLTFSSRTYIWKRALELIPLKMFMGYGTTDFFIPAFGGVDHPAHNEVLNVLYRGGLCSFVFIFSAFILIVKSSIGKTPWNRVCMALLFGMVIVMITEILSAQNSYHFILSLCYFINTVWNDKEKTISI
ncbi:MAG: O-antigen ligase family protein [Faecalibacterium prausnitzii]